MNGYPIPYHPTWDVNDPSKLNDFVNCPREYFYAHLLGWKGERPNNHLVFGQAWHKAMEHLLLHGYDPVSIQEAQEKLTNHYRKEFPEETDELFEPKTPIRATIALVKYTLEYPHDLDKFKVLYTEVAGTVPITDEQILFYRMDNILQRHQDEQYFSQEHKTGTNLTNQWRMQWPLSIQIGCYVHALYCMYPQELVRGVSVSGTFFKRTKAPLFDFGRVPCWKLPHQMRTWYHTVSYYLAELTRERELLSQERDSNPIMMSFPMRPTNCDKFYGCAFHDFCLAWPNPLQHCDEPPLGFKAEWWDPRENEATHRREFKPLAMIEEMLQSLEGRNERMDM